ncbi:hypothetical protein [Alysiella crassa]|uniref:hypothetical protein n=1 Tax=Alysiella crassa TaxID=153491 RepID=UPI0012EC0D52|nr:hypothetical protein [Alysiella crassa]UOP07718.1 hypothetical protein LVJ80_05025 [Alysiella crassa]
MAIACHFVSSFPRLHCLIESNAPILPFCIVFRQAARRVWARIFRLPAWYFCHLIAIYI